MFHGLTTRSGSLLSKAVVHQARFLWDDHKEGVTFSAEFSELLLLISVKSRA